jgi:hypothetical protein
MIVVVDYIAKILGECYFASRFAQDMYANQRCDGQSWYSVTSRINGEAWNCYVAMASIW